MFKYLWQKCLLASSVILSLFSNFTPLLAFESNIFAPYLDLIPHELPTGLTFRLPDHFDLFQHSDINPDNLIITRFGSNFPLKYNLSVFTCKEGIYSCLIASFSVERADSIERFNELVEYSRRGDPIILNPDYQGFFIRGFLLEGNQKNPPSAFSTVMWQQDYMIYTISFPAEERQSLLYLALSMAQQAPIYPRR